MEPSTTTAEVQRSAAQAPRQNQARARMLIAAALALVVCRLVGAWHSIVGMAAAGLVMASLAIVIVSISPRLRRWMFCLMLPLAVGANAATLAAGSCLACMGSQGLLPGARLGLKVPWTPVFWCVPLAATVNLWALAKHGGAGFRNRRGAALVANLVTVLFGLWYWTIHGAQVYPYGPPPLGAVLLSAAAAISFATVVWDSPRPITGSKGGGRRVLWRVAFVSAVTVPIVATIVVAFLPVYRNRQTIAELESLGFSVLNAWGDELSMFDDLTNVRLLQMRPTAQPSAADTERFELLSKRLPSLSGLFVQNVPSGGGSLLQSLRGRGSLTQLTLTGPGITDETLADIATLPSLTQLDVSHSNITDKGLADLAKLRALQVLNLSGTSITGKGLSKLAALPRLWAIELADIPLDDSELSALQPCTSLYIVNLRGTRVTDEGVARLRQTLPRLIRTDAGLSLMVPGAIIAPPRFIAPGSVAAPRSNSPAPVASPNAPSPDDQPEPKE